MTATPYRTLFLGTLRQTSALGVGGTDEPGLVDQMLSRDGLGRLTLRGQALAGALIATARKLYDDLPESITSGVPGARGTGRTTVPSRWRTYPSHLPPDTETRLRQCSGIRQATSAAASGALFDLETISRDAEWAFLLEVDTAPRLGQPDGGRRAEGMAAAVLLEWCEGRCWLGRAVSRGLGWMQMEELRAVQLHAGEWQMWPDSSRSLNDVLRGIEREHDSICADDFADRFQLPVPQSPWVYVEIPVTIRAGLREDGYGLDALSVGGDEARLGGPCWRDDHYLGPLGQTAEAFAETVDSDGSLASTPDGTPFIPGSGLKGPLRHHTSARLRAEDGDGVRDPTTGAQPDKVEQQDAAEELFGSVVDGSALLVRDAYLAEDSDWVAALFEHHAEDEFSAGVYGPSKFDRLAVLEGTWQTRLVIEAPDEERAEKLWKRLQPTLSAAERGHLSVGGGSRRGFGWPVWKVGKPVSKKAGEEWSETNHPDPAGDAEESESPQVESRRGRQRVPSDGSGYGSSGQPEAAPAQEPDWSDGEESIWIRQGVSEESIVEYLNRRGWLEASDSEPSSDPPKLSWVEPSAVLRNGETPEKLQRRPPLRDRAPATDRPLYEARLFWARRSMHLVAAGDGCRWCEWREDEPPANDEGDEFEELPKVVRARGTVCLRRDWSRFGLDGTDLRDLIAVEYWHLGRRIGWRLEPGSGEEDDSHG